MTIELAVNIGLAIFGAILTVSMALIGMFAKKLDKKLEGHEISLKEHEKAHSALELKTSETYATKTTMLSLFQETTRTNEAAISRVEKSVDITNAAIAKQGEKIDRVVDSIGQMQTNIMTELVKKT